MMQWCRYDIDFFHVLVCHYPGLLCWYVTDLDNVNCTGCMKSRVISNVSTKLIKWGLIIAGITLKGINGHGGVPWRMGCQCVQLNSVVKKWEESLWHDNMACHKDSSPFFTTGFNWTHPIHGAPPWTYAFQSLPAKDESTFMETIETNLDYCAINHCPSL